MKDHVYVLCVLHSTYLPFSDTINGPPESPWHESLLLSPAQMWKLNMSIYFLYLLVKIILLPFNFARIISVTLFVRHDRHLNLLECWCRTAIRGGVPPPSHRGHLASVQGLGGGGEAKWGNSGGEGEREGQEEDREIIISGVKIISGVIPDLRNIS